LCPKFWLDQTFHTLIFSYCYGPDLHKTTTTSFTFGYILANVIKISRLLLPQFVLSTSFNYSCIHIYSHVYTNYTFTNHTLASTQKHGFVWHELLVIKFTCNNWLIWSAALEIKTFRNTNPLDAIVPHSSVSRQHTDKLCKKMMAKTFEVGWIAGVTDMGDWDGMKLIGYSWSAR
jgi:hypothetical protein